MEKENDIELEEYKRIFGANLKKIRKGMKMNQTDFGNAIGYSGGNSAISQIEDGTNLMEHPFIIRAAKFIGIHPAALMVDFEYNEEQLSMMLTFFKVIKDDKNSPHYVNLRSILKDYASK